MKALLVVFFLLATNQSFSYPNFIGHGYRSCLSCHDSPTGGGSLNDYGRAVFASEIAANPISGMLSDEEASQMSNFLFKKELPWWIRLGVKSRYLNVVRRLGESNQSSKSYLMQADLNLNFFVDEDKKYGFISTLGYIDNRNALSPNRTLEETSYLFLREYFFRIKWSDEYWVSLGLMDKAYGLKTADHTAINRSYLGLGQNDQQHSLQVLKSNKAMDLFFQVWAGNLQAEKINQVQGASTMLDHKLGETNSLGGSLLYETGDRIERMSGATHAKLGFENGHSIIAEVGYTQLKNKVFSTNSNSIYLFNENLLKLTRGYYFMSAIQGYQAVNQSGSLNTIWSLGVLMFPIQRFELRVSVNNQRQFNQTTKGDDQWNAQSQAHFSF